MNNCWVSWINCCWWESVCWGVLKISLLENDEVSKIRKICSRFCFEKAIEHETFIFYEFMKTSYCQQCTNIFDIFVSINAGSQRLRDPYIMKIEFPTNWTSTILQLFQNTKEPKPILNKHRNTQEPWALSYEPWAGPRTQPRTWRKLKGSCLPTFLCYMPQHSDIPTLRAWRNQKGN